MKRTVAVTLSAILVALAILPPLVGAAPTTLTQRVIDLERRVAILEALHATPAPSPSPSATPTVAPSPTPTVAPTATPSPACGTNLQSMLDAIPTGGTLNLTGCTYAGGVTISRSVTIRGGTIIASGSTQAVVVQASDVTVDGVTIIGGRDGVWAISPTNLVVRNSTITDQTYSGVMLLSAVGGRVEGNDIRRIGVGQPDGTNAYGVAISHYSGQPQSRDVAVIGNVVTDVPTWHAFDTHGGIRILFEGNASYSASRAYFITAGTDGSKATDVIVRGNLAGNPSPVTYNLNAITLYATVNSVVTGNAVSAGYGCPASYVNCVYDYAGASTGLAASGNYIGETLP